MPEGAKRSFLEILGPDRTMARVTYNPDLANLLGEMRGFLCALDARSRVSTMRCER